MAKLTSATYSKPVPAEKENPYIEGVRQYTDKGIDTPFALETTADEYKADKLLIQKAVNVHGYSAREVETTFEDGQSGKTAVKSTFLIRPARKRKGSEDDNTSADAAE